MQTTRDNATVMAGLGELVHPGTRILTPSEARADAAVPVHWTGFVDAHAPGRSRSLLDAWAPFAAELPGILDFLDGHLQGLRVARGQDGIPALLYLYTVGGDPNVFCGRAPIARVPERLLPVWDRVPVRLREFYTQLHDGWTFVPANSMGPLPLADWAFLSDDRFDIDAETARNLPIDVERTVAVFHNGAGDYLCLDCGGDGVGEASGIIWWHDDPADPETVDFWGVLDAWVCLFLEEADGV